MTSGSNFNMSCKSRQRDYGVLDELPYR